MEELEKIGVRWIEPYRKDGKWKFRHRSKELSAAPAGISTISLPPDVLGADQFFDRYVEGKGLTGDVRLLFSDRYLPNPDLRIVFVQSRDGGDLYRIEGENFALSGRVWVCSYFRFFFEKPPDQIYLKLEARE